MRVIPGASLVLLALMGVALVPAAPSVPSGATVVDYWVASEGGALAHGLVTRLPEGEAPTAFLLILHGYGHQAESHRAHLQTLAEKGVLAVAMDYRGPQDGFPLAAGAADSVAAARDLLARHPVEDSYLYSVSMGTAVAAMVVPELPGVFDAWVIGEGLGVLHETWAGATLLKPSGNPTAVRAAEAIEQETGGTPATVPLEYAKRSAALRVPEYEGFPIGIILTHGLNDGLVPYNQGREMVGALRANGFKADFYTVVRGEARQEGTTLTGYAGQNVDGLAGHGSEAARSHTLTGLTLDLLDRVLAKDPSVLPANRELVVDRGLGTLP